MPAWLRDTIERTAATAVQAFLATLLASGTLDLDVSTVQAAALAGLAAGLAVITAAIAARWPQDSLSPASLAPAKPTED